uniref:EAL domain-containing protein n=1 Tax=Ascaris lumbricoides TaxID=6252 RepID=A0A0M3I7S7_ASCLU
MTIKRLSADSLAIFEPTSGSLIESSIRRRLIDERLFKFILERIAMRCRLSEHIGTILVVHENVANDIRRSAANLCIEANVSGWASTMRMTSGVSRRHAH